MVNIIKTSPIKFFCFRSSLFQMHLGFPKLVTCDLSLVLGVFRKLGGGGVSLSYRVQNVSCFTSSLQHWHKLYNITGKILLLPIISRKKLEKNLSKLSSLRIVYILSNVRSYPVVRKSFE